MAKTIDATEQDIEIYRSLTEALGLIDLDVVKCERHKADNLLILYCVPRWGVDVCPDCGCLVTKVHDYPRQRTIHDAPVRGYQTLLVFDAHRLECPRCHAVFTLRIRDVVPECTYTYRLAELVANPERKQDAQTLARTFGLGYKTVESMLLKAAEEKLNRRVHHPIQVKHLGIDEISNRKGHGDYVLVLTDLERRVVLDILPDRRKSTLIEWLTDPPSGVDLSTLDTVATDLWRHYRDAIDEVFGDQVSVVADRFHVVQNLNDAIHEARRAAQRNADTEEESKQLKGLRYVLIKKDAKLTDADKTRLDALRISHPVLYRLTQLRQQLYEWYETDTTPEAAERDLDQWLTDAAELGLSSLDAFCTTLRNWKSEVVNFFVHRVTSGFVEGMNSKIRLVKRIAFGLPNFEHFRLRILWACG